ncbi:hypothetical protein HY745_05815 [Candidatus Desantisbacteria bacterium]|nr:hypothetical protein [Candidatus Desantisbacteria bacterium]
MNSINNFEKQIEIGQLIFKPDRFLKIDHNLNISVYGINLAIWPLPQPIKETYNKFRNELLKFDPVNMYVYPYKQTHGDEIKLTAETKPYMRDGDKFYHSVKLEGQ